MWEMLKPLVNAVGWILIISAIGWWARKLIKGVVDYLLEESKKE